MKIINSYFVRISELDVILFTGYIYEKDNFITLLEKSEIKNSDPIFDVLIHTLTMPRNKN